MIQKSCSGLCSDMKAPRSVKKKTNNNNKNCPRIYTLVFRGDRCTFGQAPAYPVDVHSAFYQVHIHVHMYIHVHKFYITSVLAALSQEHVVTAITV